MSFVMNVVAVVLVKLKGLGYQKSILGNSLGCSATGAAQRSEQEWLAREAKAAG
jgi:hypothetical protein